MLVFIVFFILMLTLVGCRPFKTKYNFYSIKERVTYSGASFDVGWGKLVVGLSKANQIRIYDIKTWNYEIIYSQDQNSVHSVSIYYDLIVYSPFNLKGSIMIYNMTYKSHYLLGIYTERNIYGITANKEDGIIYFISEYGDFCFDLKTN
ncbi:MAG: hypothetical protein PHV87_05435 [Bacilli bacterium]|nr:hypothetical protein [Bacilli bacterium]